MVKSIGKYIYGIIPAKAADIKLWSGVSLISYKDISAVVSNEQIVDCSHMLKNSMAMLLVRHQRVVEQVMSMGYSIIPVKLGTFVKDETEGTEVLRKGYNVIKDISDKISSKVEIDVVATWSDFSLIVKEVGNNREIKEVRERLLSSVKGVSVEDQMKVGLMVKKAIDGKREECAFFIKSALMSISCVNKEHALMDDKMVVNAAFLMDVVRQKDFEKEVELLNLQFDEKLNFRCVGPLPPYSFYTLEVKKMEFEEIDWARKKLGLGEVVTQEEIKKAHHKMAYCYHPDQNPDKTGTDKEFDNITRAYKILQDYCQAYAQEEENNKFYLNPEKFSKNSMLIKARG